MDNAPLSELSASQAERSLERIRALVRVWEEAVRIPGLGWRVGLDGLIGLVPGFGDLVGAVVSLYPIIAAVRLGAGTAIVARMLVNVGIDTVVGAVPLIGDLFDVGWKANRLNHDLLVRWLESPRKTGRASTIALGAMALGMIGAFAAIGWMVTAAVVAVLR